MISVRRHENNKWEKKVKTKTKKDKVVTRKL